MSRISRRDEEHLVGWKTIEKKCCDDFELDLDDFVDIDIDDFVDIDLDDFVDIDIDDFVDVDLDDFVDIDDRGEVKGPPSTFGLSSCPSRQIASFPRKHVDMKDKRV